MSPPLRICGMGMVTAIGHTVQETFTSLESGLCRFRETPIVGLDGRRLVACLAMPVSPELTGLTRAITLASPALAECVEQADGAPGRRTALLLCLPARAEWNKLLGCVASELEMKYRLPVRALATFDTGHAAGIVALRRAAELLDSGAADQCILGGVDSAGERAILERLDMLDQVKSARAPHGVVPGEAAAFLCLRRAAEELDGASVAGTCCVHDPAKGRSAGEGLTAAITGVLTAWGGDPRAVAFMNADLTGDRARAQAVAFATLRTLWRERALPALVHPADRLGDVGAASAPLLLGLAARRLMDEHSREAAMVLCSSATTLRGAAMVTTPREGRRSG